MCSYGISVKEIVCAVGKTLDELEGDFSANTLIEALEIVQKKYPYTSDRLRSEKKWLKQTDGDRCSGRKTDVGLREVGREKSKPEHPPQSNNK